MGEGEEVIAPLAPLRRMTKVCPCSDTVAPTMFSSLSPRARLLLKISFMTTFAEAMLVPMYAAFAEKVGGSILDAGIAFAVFSMATGGAVALIGTRPWFQHNIRRFLMLGFVLSASCDISFIFVDNKWELFGTQIVAGFATGMIEPTWDALFTDDIEHSSAKHWSIWAGGTHLTTGAASLVGGLVVAYSSFAILFATMAGIDALALFVAWRGLRDTAPASS
jgi:predicted MFS family arabinose efflux permease